MTLKRGDSLTIERAAGWGSITVRAGILDEDAVTLYRNGQCHALALELNRRTGWPLWWLGRPECVYDTSCPPTGYADHLMPSEYGPDQPVCPCQVEHVGVLRPDGAFVDIGGARAVAEAVEPGEYGPRYEVTQPASPQTIDSLRHGRDGWPRPNMAAARLFVDALLPRLS